MKCLDCNLASICSAYDKVKQFAPHIKMEVTSCSYKTSGPAIQKEILPMENVMIPPVIKKYKDFREVSKPKDTEIKILESKDDEPIKTVCSTCQGNTLLDDVGLCFVCNTTICSNCSTESENKRYCESCWIKL